MRGVRRPPAAPPCWEPLPGVPAAGAGLQRHMRSRRPSLPVSQLSQLYTRAAACLPACLPACLTVRLPALGLAPYPFSALRRCLVRDVARGDSGGGGQHAAVGGTVGAQVGQERHGALRWHAEVARAEVALVLRWRWR